MLYRDIINFVFVKDINIWQDVFLSSIFIPIIIISSQFIWKWWNGKKPLNLLLKGYKNSENGILVFLAQLSQADTEFNKIEGPLYVQFFPKPSPTDQSNFEKIRNINIDPVWSETDGLCVSDIFNVLGKAAISKNIKIANLIRDWDNRTSPIFSVGFNAKTIDLIPECEPIYFKLDLSPSTLSIDGYDEKLNSIPPNDAGIIQKTFLRGSNTPVFILAGLGTTGTAVPGYFFSKNCVDLGKLYGNNPFCILLKTNQTKGRTFFEIKALYPRPPFRLSHPLTYLKWRKMKVYPK